MGEKVGRKRSRHACLRCRGRKVRCDVMMQGKSCTNCKLDWVECVIQPKKSKKERQDEMELQVQTPSTVDGSKESAMDLATWHPVDPNPETDLDQMMRMFTNMEEEQPQVLIDEISPPTSSISPSQLDEVCPDVSGVSWTTSIALTSCPEFCETSENVQPHPESFGNSSSERPTLFIFYPFISVDTPQGVSSENASAMEDLSCFHLPSTLLMDEFIRAYFLYVQPFLPVIDEVDFWNSYSAPPAYAQSEKQIPLLVIQTMLFMSCPFVPSSVLSALGYSSVRTARAAFYSRAKALFDSNFCADDTSKAQAALMLTYHSNVPREFANTEWLNIAIYFAQRAGADHHYNRPDESKISSRLKRLWWCCILRDRIMALGLRRPASIKASGFSSTRHVLTENDLQNEIWGSRVYKPDEKRALTDLFLTLCKFGIILSDLIPLLYPVDGAANKEMNSHELPETKRQISKLDLWHQRAVERSRQLHQNVRHLDSFLLLSNASSIYYQSARTALLNHAMLISFDGVGMSVEDSKMCQQWAQAELKKTLHGVANELIQLEDHGLARYLPNTFISLLVFSFVWYTLGTNPREKIHQSDEILAGLNACASYTTRFKDFYENADALLPCIEKLVQCARSSEAMGVLFPRANDPRKATHLASSLISNENDQYASLNTTEAPYHYLWITLSIDHSLCYGQLPTRSELPQCLRVSMKKSVSSGLV